MRRLVWLACLGAFATANAGPVPRRPPKDTPVKMIRALIEVLTLDRWGSVVEAEEKYTNVFDVFAACSGMVKHCDKTKAAPPAAMGVMFLDAALHNLPLDMKVGSVKMLQSYLDAVPDAPDRAEVEKLITELRSRDKTVTIGGHVSRGARDEVDAIVLVDGVVIGNSPVTTTVKPGFHVAERITKSTYAGKVFETHATWEPVYEELFAATDEGTGNVVISGDIMWSGCTTAVDRKCHPLTLHEGKSEIALGRRFTLPVGHHRIASGMCKAFELEVRSKTALNYVRVDGKATPDRCFDVTHVSTKLLEVKSP